MAGINNRKSAYQRKIAEKPNVGGILPRFHMVGPVGIDGQTDGKFWPSNWRWAPGLTGGSVSA